MRITEILFFYSSASIIMIIIMLQLFPTLFVGFYELNKSFHRVTLWFLSYCSQRFCWLNLETITILRNIYIYKAYNFNLFRAIIQRIFL